MRDGGCGDAKGLRFVELGEVVAREAGEGLAKGAVHAFGEAVKVRCLRTAPLANVDDVAMMMRR